MFVVHHAPQTYLAWQFCTVKHTAVPAWRLYDFIKDFKVYGRSLLNGNLNDHVDHEVLHTETYTLKLIRIHACEEDMQYCYFIHDQLHASLSFWFWNALFVCYQQVNWPYNFGIQLYYLDGTRVALLKCYLNELCRVLNHSAYMNN